MASISIEWRPIGNVSGLPGHLYLVYRGDGQPSDQWRAISGGPENGFPALDYGRLMSGYLDRNENTPNTAGQVLEDTIDNYEQDNGNPQSRGSTILAEGSNADMAAVWSRMVSVANEIFAREYTYIGADLLPPFDDALNSNTVIMNVLKQAGLPFTLPDAPSTMTFPGADLYLNFAGSDVWDQEWSDVVNYSRDAAGIVANLSATTVDGLQAGQIRNGWGFTDIITADSGVESIVGTAANDNRIGLQSLIVNHAA